MLLALAGVSSVAMAQQKTEVVEEFGVIQVQDKYQVITNPFWSNWFFSIGGGAEATFGDNDKLGIENSVRYSCRTAGYKKSGSSCDGFAETFCDWTDGCSNTGNRKCCEYDYRIGAY